jgi:hypothetical protein
VIEHCYTSHGSRTEPTSVEPSIPVTCSSTTVNSRERLTSNEISCPETADHPGQTLDDGCKALRQAQEADWHPAGHAVNTPGHHG